METPAVENFSPGKEEFMSQVRLALAQVLDEYKGQGNLLRPKINACLEEHFGIRSREINLQIPEGYYSFSLKFSHPIHGEMTLEA
jgi:hypothetical protein